MAKRPRCHYCNRDGSEAEGNWVSPFGWVACNAHHDEWNQKYTDEDDAEATETISHAAAAPTGWIDISKMTGCRNCNGGRASGLGNDDPRFDESGICGRCKGKGFSAEDLAQKVGDESVLPEEIRTYR